MTRTKSSLLIALPILVVSATLGCGPQGPMGILPGGPLAGDVVAAPVTDWRFSDDDMTVAIETRGAWLDHSVTVLAVADGPYLYIPAREGHRKRWVANVMRDGRVRIGVDGKIYSGVATRVLDANKAGDFANLLLRKYLGLEADHAGVLLEQPSPGDDRVDIWLFRVASTAAEE